MGASSKSFSQGSQTIFPDCMGIKTPVLAGSWWLMPVILATQEAEIRRIMV
jgi:hypothetical protein